MNSRECLDIDKMQALLSANGPLAKIFEGFEEREGQLQLIKKISECFNNAELGVFEAGTGVGKSLAYLLPSILWAKKNNSRVIISTATINLQQQLVEKDAPLALRILNLSDEFADKIVLVKGRRNFLCLRRFYSYTEQDELFEENTAAVETLKRLIAGEKFSGSKDNLDFFVPANLWSNICSESDNCLSSHCPFFAQCYVMRMKKKAEAAQVLIANHHLLFNDLLAKLENDNFDVTTVLPAFKTVVLDEAHAIEEAARSGFSESVNTFFFKKQLNALYRSGGKKQSARAVGALPNVIALSSRADLFAEAVQLIAQAAKCFDELEQCALSLIPDDYTWSFLQSNFNDKEKLKSALNNFVATLYALNKDLSIILQNIPEADDDDEDTTVYESEEELASHEAGVIVQRLKDMQAFFEQFEASETQEDYIFWFEKLKSNSGNFIQFYKTPINLEKFMQSALFMPMDSVICTSATLQVSGSFNFSFKNLGLKNFTEKKIELGTFQSPFPYQRNVLFNIPTDAPLPVAPNFNEYVCKTVLQLVQASRGRALVLFTSYSLLKIVTDAVKNTGALNFPIYFQGEYERAKLLELFKNEVDSCLFATESFWTGVDVPGEALSHVVLVKLPFEVPNHPIVFAKSRFIELHGGKAFFELSVPQAVIKFKQGFGRLMRSKTDKGVITVLDNRLLKKSYGGSFLQSIPKTRNNFAATEKIISETKSFLN